MARKIITCSACGARFDVSKYPAGSRVRCGRCNQVLTVPPDEPGAAPVIQPSATVSRGQPQGRQGPVIAPSAPGPSRGAQASPQSTASQPMSPASSGAPGASGSSGPAAAAPPQDSDPLVGRVIHGQYRIQKKLGEGGYGAVYEAKDVNLERRVAIKIMLQARAQSREYVAKFLREARTAAQLSHPNVVAVHGVGFDRDVGVHFLAMEFVEGRTLHDLLQERGPLPVEEACNYIVQSCRGLHAAHERNIIHRDIKPGNLMLTPGNAVKITDFGLAKVYDAEAAQSTVIGTPYFMPPEQFEGKAKDGRTDIYALGVTFYYMLTMQRPHTGAGPAQILLSVMTKEPQSVLEHRPELPEGLWPIVKRMIHRDLDRRYATCAEIIGDIERLLGGGEEEVEQLYCPACGVPNALEAPKCAGCGESLQEKCPVCGEVDAAGTKFCGNCGSNIPLERAVLALLEEAQAFVQSGRLNRAREKLHSAQERSPQNLRIAQLLRDLEMRREQRDAHRDSIRDLLAQGRPEEALERWKIAHGEFPESVEIGELEADITTARAARASAGAASADAIAGARAMETEGRIRDALVAWRGVLVLLPGNDDALQGETRCRERVERADTLVADAAEFVREGDPETAQIRLREAAEILPRDPVVEGRSRETERMVEEVRAEIAAAEELMGRGESDAAVERLRILAARYRRTRRVRDALTKAELAGRAASEGAVRDRLQRALAAAARHDEAKHFRDALASWREAVQLDPDCADAEAGLARAQRAIAESEALLGQSRSLLGSGDPDGAVAAAEQALALLADDPAAAAQLARARTSLETIHHEADRIRAAIATDPEEDVLNWARELATRCPGSPLAADVLRDTEKAFREAEEKASESRASTLLSRAKTLEQQRQFERAAAAYEEAVRAAPGHAEAKKALEALRTRLATAAQKTDEAHARLDAGDPEAAKSLAEEAQKLLPDQVRTASVLAGARTALAEIARTAEGMEQGAGVTLDRAEAQLERMRRLRAKYPGSAQCGELESRAAAIADTARGAAQRQRIQSRIDAAQKALAEGRLADALRSAEEAKAIEPSDAVVAGILAKVAERREQGAALLGEAREAAAASRHEDALKLFDRALEADPENADAAAGRAETAAEIERVRDLVRRAQGEAVQADRAGRPEDALAAWERVVQIDASHPKAAKEAERIRAWLAKAGDALAAVDARIADGDPEAAFAAAQEARTKLGAWEKFDDAYRRSRALVEEIDQGVRRAERDLGNPEGELAHVAEAAAALAAKFPASRKARDSAARAAAGAEERRRAIAISQVRKLVREHRYDEAVAAAAVLRAQGVVSGDLDGAEGQAKRVLSDVSRLRDDAKRLRTTGDLDGARSALVQVQALLHDEGPSKEAVVELEETIREYTARIDAAETSRRRGDLTRALETFRDALALNPGAASLQARLDEVSGQQAKRAELVRACETSIRGGDADACVRTAKDLLVLFPDDDDARDLQSTGEAMRNLVATLLAHAKRQRDLGEQESARITAECILRVVPGHAEAAALAAAPAAARA